MGSPFGHAARMVTMNRKIKLCAFLCLGFLQVEAQDFVPTDLSEFESHIQPFLTQHCAGCHDDEKQKGKFFLHDIDGSVTGGKDTVRWEKILEMVSLGDMPPEDEPRPSKVDRNRVEGWISNELSKIDRGLDPAKLALPHQANRVDHEELFSGRTTTSVPIVNRSNRANTCVPPPLSPSINALSPMTAVDSLFVIYSDSFDISRLLPSE